MSKKMGKREARNRLFEALAHEVENSDVGLAESDRDNIVINAERATVAARIRKLISVPKAESKPEESAEAAE